MFTARDGVIGEDEVETQSMEVGAADVRLLLE
jgi:hypothetical protein